MDSKITHALSIREPYAYLIAAGFKNAEIRSFPFPKTIKTPAWIAIHASLSRAELNDQDVRDGLLDLDDELDLLVYEDETWAEEKTRVFGHSEIIGAMRICMNLRADDTDDKWDQWYEVMEGRSDRCTTAVDPLVWLDDEQNNWIIDDCLRFANPIVCPGRLNVWPLGTELESLVTAEFTRALADGGLSRSEPLGKPLIHEMPRSANQKLYTLFRD
jgi:hypothetical protein